MILLPKEESLKYFAWKCGSINGQRSKHYFNPLASDYTFGSLFKQRIAKKILLHYLDELESKRPALLNYRPRSDKDLLATLIINNPDLGPKKIFQLYGLKRALETPTSHKAS